MHILLVGDYPADPKLGSPKVLYRLRDEFIAAGHQAALLLAPDLGAVPRSRHLRDVMAPWLAWRALHRLLSAGGRFDVIDASGAEALLIAQRLRRRPAQRTTAVIARSHGLEHLNYARMLADAREGLAPRPWYRRMWYPATRMRLVARAATLADRLIVLNSVDRAFAIDRDWKDPDQISIVPHGVSDLFLSRAPRHNGGAGLLFCGSWDAAKGIHYLIRAFGQLSARRPDVQLTVLGPGAAPKAVIAAFPEHARARVRVVSRADEREMIEEFERHAALVMCSTYEGFGMVVAEAMALGRPVIATPVGAAATLVRDGETGILVPVRDADRLALAMERLLDDAQLRARLGAAARAAVQSLTWAASARRTLEVYRTALASVQRSPAQAVAS